MKFIKLSGKENGLPIYFNSDLITIVEPVQAGTKVHLINTYELVKESPTKIFQLLGTTVNE